MVREAEAATGRRVGIYAEMKEPHFFTLNGFHMEGTLVDVLHAKHVLAETLLPPAGSDVPAPLVIQCFDADALRSLARRLPSVPLVQLLLSPTSKEHPSVGQGVSAHLGREAHYGDMALADIAAYASGIGPSKTVFTQLSPEEGRALVDAAHALDLGVHPWTFRREPMFVDRAFAQDSDEELRFFYECLNVDALFVEFPDDASMVIARMLDWEGREVGAEAVEAAAGQRAVGGNGTTAAARRLARRRQQQQKQQQALAGGEKSTENVTATPEEAGPARPAAAVVSTRATATTTTSSSSSSSSSMTTPAAASASVMEAFGLGACEMETCLQLCKARACSSEGPAFCAPSYVVPWLHRSAF